jgi:hypothetical protein
MQSLFRIAHQEGSATTISSERIERHAALSEFRIVLEEQLTAWNLPAELAT